MTDTLLTIFKRKVAALPMDKRGPLIAAYEEYLRGHIGEGFALLGEMGAGRTAADLVAAIEGRVIA